MEDVSAELHRTVLKVKVDQASISQAKIDITATAPPPGPSAQSPPRHHPPQRLAAATSSGDDGGYEVPQSSALVIALERKVMELQERAEAFEEERDKAARSVMRTRMLDV